MLSKKPERAIPLILFSVIVIQLIGKYYGAQTIIWGSFHLSFFIGRIFVPLILAVFVLKLSLRELGWGWPQWKPGWIFFGLVCLVLVPLIVSLILLDESYLRAYPYYANASYPVAERISSFGLFTISTLIGWELMHRGFLLFGVFQVLKKRARLDQAWAASIAISVTAAFEVIFHFQKPDLESWGLLLASPIFSWMALRMKSLWLPAFLHLYIEICFILTLVLSHTS